MRHLPLILFFLSWFACQSSANAETVGDIVSRVQTDLNRVAAGLPRLEPRHTTNADRLVDAFSALLADDPAETRRAMQILDKIETQASVSLRQFERSRRRPVRQIYALYNAIDASLKLEPRMSGPDGPWIRFVAISRKAVYAGAMTGRDPTEGRITIPCSVSGRLTSLAIATDELSAYVPTLTNCPERRQDQRTVFLTGDDELSSYLEAAHARAGRGSAEEVIAPEAIAGTPDWARRHMGDQPDAAEAILRASHDIRSRLDYALFLYFFRPASIERDDRIRRAFSAMVVDAISTSTDSYRKRFDFTFLRADIDHLVDTMFRSPFTNGYPFPCAIVFRAPYVLDYTEPRYGGGGDAFMPTSDCDLASPEMAGYPFAAVKQYRRLGRFAGRYGTQGSIWTSIHVSLNADEYRVEADPRALLDRQRPVARPYETWAYLSISNHTIWRKINEAYEAALTGLQPFYRKLGLTEDEARIAAENGLDAITLGPDCGGAPPPQSFRKLLLDDAPMDELAAFAESGGWRDAALLTPFVDCGYYAGIEPLAHVAIRDMLKFEYLRALAETLTREERMALDLDMDVDARNAFGKTPLMTAIQFGMTDAASWLTAHGADLSATTDSGLLESGRRTLLMYAAAAGSLAMIRTLIDAGADPLQADTMGHTALHYLLGAGPAGQPLNPNLSDEDLRAAYALLR